MAATDHPSARVSRGPLVLVVFIAALIAACSGSGSTILSTVGNAVDDHAGAEPAAPSAVAGGSQLQGSGRGSGGGSTGGSNPQAPVDDAKIVRTGSMNVQVGDLGSAVAKGHDAVISLGGYVGQSRQTNDGDKATATVAYRIPVARWDDALGAFRGIASKVLTEQTDAVEVTGQLIDMNARLANLRASETALQGILEKATKVQDILDVEGRLSDVRGQIEQLDAQRAHLADQASLATLTVTFTLPVVAVTEATKDWDPATEVDRATASLVDILQAGAAAGIWFAIVWIPILAFLAIVIGIAALAARRLGIVRTRSSGPDIAGGEAS